MTARTACLLLTTVLSVPLLSGCDKEYNANLRYTFAPYTLKDAKTITLKREADGRVIQVLAAGEAPAATPEVLTALAGDLPAGQEKGVGIDVAKVINLPPAEQGSLNESLMEFFGTPRDPKVEVDSAIVEDPQMQLQPEHLKAGSKLYRKLCLYCHGLNGDGGGPTGMFLTPKPRDFRLGVFKFRSTVKIDPDTKQPVPAAPVTPSFDDIRRTLQRGVPTASMPSFNLLSDQDLDALTSYVIHLSLRGMSEYRIVRGETSEVEEAVTLSAKTWLYGSPGGSPTNNQKALFVPPEPPKGWGAKTGSGTALTESPGFKAYRGDGKCVECHWTDGRANPLDVPTNLGRMNDWGQLNPPRNLTYGVYRGGARPIDIFWRIKLGVGGSGMPAAAAWDEEKKTGLKDEDIWNLVDYVMTLPTQQR